jgi:hypothetical protein
MRARHRHLKSKSLGASVCLDARYISASNNDALSAWDDISGNSRNASQPTSSRRPTFIAAASGGSAAVNFGGDSANPQEMTISVPSTRPISVIAVQWKNAANGKIGSLSNNSDLYAAVDWSDQIIYAEGRGIRGGSFGAGGFTTASVFSTVTDTLDDVYINGSQRTRTQIATTGTNADFSIVGKTYAVSDFSNGRLAFVLAVSSALPNPLRKRLEHSAAFSWKISCN